MAVITEYFKNLQLPEIIINEGEEGSLHLQMLFTEPVSAVSDYSRNSDIRDFPCPTNRTGDNTYDE